jgi:hypothetical protein
MPPLSPKLRFLSIMLAICVPKEREGGKFSDQKESVSL